MPSKGSRERAEARFLKTRISDQELRSAAELEREEIRKKTAGLKAQRLAREQRVEPANEGSLASGKGEAQRNSVRSRLKGR